VFHDLILRSEAVDVSEDQAAALLAQEVITVLSIEKLGNTVEQWIFACELCSEMVSRAEPASIDDAEKSLMIEGDLPRRLSYKEIKDRPVWPAVEIVLTPQQQQLVEDLARRKVSLCLTERKAKITYQRNVAATVAARIQDPLRCGTKPDDRPARVTLVIQVLAPNNRRSRSRAISKVLARGLPEDQERNFSENIRNTRALTWHRRWPYDCGTLAGRQCHFAGTAAKNIPKHEWRWNSWHRPLADDRRTLAAANARLTIGPLSKTP